jgi:hypothetical protein
MTVPQGRLKGLIEADPAAAAKLLQELQKKLVIPHDGQKLVVDSDARFRILNAGRRWGKTKIGVKIALQETRKNEQMIWWVAPTYAVVKRGYREVLRQLPDGVLTKPPAPDTAFDSGRKVVLPFKNGTRMEFYSAERSDGMLGEGVDFAVLDEAAIMPKAVWEQVVRPTLMDRNGGGLWISTPRGRNYFYEGWKRGQDDQYPEWASWTFPTAVNPYISADEIEEMRQTLPAAIFEQEVEAKFISKSAAVFRYDENSIRDLAEPQGSVFMGIDLAKSRDFTVLDAARASDRLPCYSDRFNTVSWPEQMRRIKTAVADLLKRGAESVTLVVDSTGVGDPIVDDLELHGYDVISVKFTQQWKQQAVMLLSSDLERNSAYLTAEQLPEFESYSYTISGSGRWTFAAPDGAHDDRVSAKLLQHWGMVTEGVPNVQMLSAAQEMDPGDHAVGLGQDAYIDAEYVDLEDDDPAEGQTVYTQIEARSTSDLMNDPASWGN